MFKTLFSKSSGSGFAKNAFLLTGGTVIAQLIPILLQPFLRRLFTTADYGTYSIYLSIVGILTIGATFRYDNAIVLPRSDKKAANILGLSVMINIIVCMLLLLISFIGRESLGNFLKIPPESRYVLHLIPAGVFLFCLQQTINFWLIRKSAFTDSAVNKITRRGAEGVIHVATGLQKIPSGLMLGDILGGVASSVSGLSRMFRKDFHHRLINLPLMKFVAKRYSEFPRYNLLPTILSAIAFQMPLLLINRYFDKHNVAEFDLARQMLNVPLAFVAVTFSQVLLQNLTEKKQNSQSVRKLLLNILYVLLVIVIFEIFIIRQWGPELFGFIFGPNWAASGQISKILVYNFALNFIMSSFTAIFISFNKIKLYSIWQIAYFFSMLSLMLFEPLPYRLFVLSYVIIDSIMIMAGLLLIAKVVRDYEWKLIHEKTAY